MKIASACAIAEVEPHLDAERPQGVHHREAVVSQPPATLVDPIGEPEGHEVGVRRDMRAIDLDVIACVSDRHQALGRHDVGEAAHQLGPAGAPGKDDDLLAAHRSS